MVGGGSKKDEGSFVISNTNVFAALDSLRKKKKSDKEKESKSSSKAPVKEPELQVFWAPAPLNAKSWADVDDDDDDDYYATTEPPLSSWGAPELQRSKEIPVAAEDSGSEEDMLDFGDEDAEEEQEHEVAVNPEPVVKKAAEAPLPTKETDRQLSKKERKKKELEELEALLADFGVAQKEGSGQGTAEEKKEVELNKEVEHNDSGDKKEGAASESKSTKKKKKDKAKETQEPLNSADVTGEQNEAAGAEQAEEEVSTVDVKGRLRKVASSKKKKINKELDAASKAAALEVATRSAKLAAAKKKEKNHYNQQPVRVLKYFDFHRLS
ncbi:hypothetical protein Nepgr_012662 [Nepenthes gracilis]|uniref:Uncharacterized protein n=1 Tax=Nepenthes gracilis TaxID=150966 RepID=A0AAD3SHI1_NEPGR|nr:hypothetical protein Nepgr_012662 [Nepenthes gracilis]